MRTCVPNLICTRAPHRAGFTFVEMMLGMIVTTLVMAAVAALMGAVGRGWVQSEASQTGSNLTSQLAIRMQRVLRGAKQLGAYRIGSIDGSATEAAVLIWKADSNYDGKVQLEEIALLTHQISGDPDDPNTIRYYELVYPSGWTAAQKAVANITLANNDEIYLDSSIEYFRDLPIVEYTVLARKVTGAEFRRYDSSTTVRPRVEYQVNLLKSGNTSELEYGTVAIRSAAPLPVSQGGP